MCQHFGVTRMHTSGCGSNESFVGHDGVGSRQRQEAPVGPVPEFLPPCTELVNLFSGVGIEPGERMEDLAGSEVDVSQWR